MAKTNALYVRIDTNLKEDAEAILRQLGISPSSAIQMLYSQIILHKGLPFEPRLPIQKPASMGDLSRKQLDSELQRGIDSLSGGKSYSADEVDELLNKEYGL